MDNVNDADSKTEVVMSRENDIASGDEICRAKRGASMS
jgi:hypothetical protein